MQFLNCTCWQSSAGRGWCRQ